MTTTQNLSAVRLYLTAAKFQADYYREISKDFHQLDWSSRPLAESVCRVLEPTQINLITEI